VSFPVQAKAGYSKFNHPASRFALTGVFVAKTPAGDVRVAATGASPGGASCGCRRSRRALKANWSPGALDSVKISADGLMSDIHGSSDYRANLIKGNGATGGHCRRLIAYPASNHASGAQRCAPLCI